MVLTHLVLYSFLNGAGGVVEPQPTGQDGVSGGGGGVANWPGRAERSWDKWWRKEDERLKRLKRKKAEAEKKVEALQKRVRGARDDLAEARELEAIQALLRDLERIQRLLDKQQAYLDELEMQEVAMVWAIWNDR